MPVIFDDIDDFLELALEYTGLGRNVTEQLDALREGERLPSDRLSADAVRHYIIPFLNELEGRGITFPELPPEVSITPFDYLLKPKLDEFTVRVTLKVMAEDEFDVISIDNRIRNALETEGLNIYTDLQVMKA